MISSHASCDHCEKKEIPADDVFASEDWLLDQGWVCLKWTEEVGEDRDDRARDFCSFLCASRWCVARVEAPAREAT